MNKKLARIRRATRTRKKLFQLGATKLVVHRTSRHIYAQIISYDNFSVLVSASTLEKLVSNQLEHTSNKRAAILVGKIIAQRAIKIGIVKVSFDRSGFRYHGRVKVLANSARQVGLKF